MNVFITVASADTMSGAMQGWAIAVIVVTVLIVGLGIGSVVVIFVLLARKRRKGNLCVGIQLISNTFILIIVF